MGHASFTWHLSPLLINPRWMTSQSIQKRRSLSPNPSVTSISQFSPLSDSQYSASASSRMVLIVIPSGSVWCRVSWLQLGGHLLNSNVASLQSMLGLCFWNHSSPKKILFVFICVTAKSMISVWSWISRRKRVKPVTAPFELRDPSALYTFIGRGNS